MKNLNIAIIGLGIIGSYLFRFLKNKKILSKKNNCIPNVVYVSAKNKIKKGVLKLIIRFGLKIILMQLNLKK